MTGVSIELRGVPVRAAGRMPRHWSEPAGAPWRVGDLLSVVLVNLIGLVLIVAGWYVAHNTTEPARHLLATNIAIGGLVIALIANAVWVLSGLREVGQLRRHLLDTHVAFSLAQQASVNSTAPDDEVLVATPEMTRYHRPGCPAVQGKHVQPASASRHADDGRRPCGICEPDWRAGLLAK